MLERCFDPWLGRLTVTQVPCGTGSTGTEQWTGLPELVASKGVSIALTFLLSSTKFWMHVSSSKIFSVSLTISLHLSHVKPSLLTETDKLYMWQTVHTTIAGEEAISHRDWWMIPTYHLPLLFDELVEKRSKRELKRSEKKQKKTVINTNRNKNDKLTG